MHSKSTAMQCKAAAAHQGGKSSLFRCRSATREGGSAFSASHVCTLVHSLASWCTVRRWAIRPSAIIAGFFKIHKSIPGTVWGFCHSGAFWVCVLSATQQITQWRRLVDRNWVYGMSGHLIHKIPPVQWQIPTIWPVFSSKQWVW